MSAGSSGGRERLPDSVFQRTTTLRELPTNTPLLLLLKAWLSINAAEPLWSKPTKIPFERFEYALHCSETTRAHRIQDHNSIQIIMHLAFNG